MSLGRLRGAAIAGLAAVSCGTGAATTPATPRDLVAETSPSPAPRGAPSDLPGRKVAAWVVPYRDSLESLERNAAWITLASPAAYRLSFHGRRPVIEDWDPAAPFPRARLERLRGRSSFSVIPLVGCIGACGPQVSRVLDDASARDAHVSALVALTEREGLDGLFIDYEDVDAAEGNVTRFVRALASELHERRRTLALVVQEPCGVDPSCRRTPFPFALGELADVVDVLAVMEYDYAVDGSAPPAPRAWVERGLDRLVDEVAPAARDKVLCGVPLYGRLSSGRADTAVLFEEVTKGRIGSLAVRSSPLRFDPTALSKVAELTIGDRAARLYLEDRETLAARLALVERYGLGGVALWRLGGEDPCMSAELARFRRSAPPPCPRREVER